MPIPWKSDVDAALAEAAKRKVPVLIDVSAAPH